MAKKYFTREQIQEILSSNSIQANASYADREPTGSPDNYIVYYRLSPNGSLTADDQIHMRKVLLQVTHYHKKKLESIEELMLYNFAIEPFQYDLTQLDTDYLATYYRFEILTSGRW